MKKKILYLSHRIPYPPNKGDKIRSFNEIKYLSANHTVDLIALADDPDDLKYTRDLEKYCGRVKIFPLNRTIAKLKGIISLLAGQSISQGYFYDKRFQDTFDKWTGHEQYDNVICFSSPMAEYLFRARIPVRDIANTLIMDFCDLDSDKWRQYASKTDFPLSFIYRKEAKRLFEFEKKINRFFGRSVFVSSGEAELFLKYYPEAKNICIVSNGVDHEFFDPEKTDMSQSFPSPMLVFSGAMDYYANVDGVVWFADKILPEIKKQVPDIKFYIVGSNPDTRVKALEKDHSIIVTGFVKDIREYYKAADICVIPLRIARGVQNKVLEAMAMAKPVISTSHAVQGISMEAKKILEIEDEPAGFAAKTIELLRNKIRREKFGIAARSFILQYYNWNSNLTGLVEWIKK